MRAGSGLGFGELYLLSLLTISGPGGACRLCLKSKARRLCVPHFPRFVLLVSSTDTLLVVSILDICGRFSGLEEVKLVR